MSRNKEDSVMGLPTGSGKRRWPDQGEEGNRAKAICTSPPHALCAEDVQKSHLPASYVQTASHAAFECEITPSAMEGIEDEETLTYDSNTLAQTKISTPREEGISDCDIDRLSDRTLDDDDDEDEEENFIDDEEDKDSGFIDGNSIDNSSDDDMDLKECQPTSASSPSVPSSQCDKPDRTETSSDLQLSLSKVLPCSSCSETVGTVSLVTTFTMSLTVASSNTLSETTTTTSSNVPLSNSFVLKPGDIKPRNASCVTTVTAAQNGTIVTSAYQGAVTTPSYDIHTYSTYSAEMYLTRPAMPAWSCNFPEGSHPTPNKYMEISPSRSHANQSIQCDENGKSYLELGSASPYTQRYITECGDFTPTTSSYNGSVYTQSFTGSTPTYGQGSTYFNTRQSYSSTPYAYHNNENYSTYEGENGCSYTYTNGSYQTSANVRPLMVNRVPQRCSSPFCDPTRTPRPSCYQQQRLSVLNMSMYKLNRYSRFPESSLHRSVLIWNTLRQIERELETEGVSMASILAQSHHYGPHNSLHGVGPSPETMPSVHTINPPNEGPLPSLHSPLVGPNIQPSHPLPPSIESPSPHPLHYSGGPTMPYHPLPSYSPNTAGEPTAAPQSPPPSSFENKDNHQILRPFAHHHTSLHDRPSSITPTTETLVVSEAEPEPVFSTSQSPQSPRSSTASTEERSEDINWCSVLSLSSQTDLDTMNNNECHEWSSEGTSSLQYPHREETPSWKLPSLSADDVLKSFPESSKRPEPSEDLDSLIKVLVGS